MRTESAEGARAIAAVALFAALILSACSPRDDQTAQTSPASAANVTLTPDQRQHIGLYTAEPSTFQKTIETTGIVDFDNDRSTSVLAPFSGPVSQLLVPLGARVKKGDALASVASPDFASAVAAYRKTIATANTARRLADLDKDLFAHQGVPEREAQQAETDAVNAEADRDAALQVLVSLDVDPQAIADIQQGGPVPRIEGLIRSPIAGTLVERLITAGQLLQAGTTPSFTIADLSRMWVMAQIFDSDIGAVRVGDVADVIAGPEGTGSITGTVDNIAAQVDPNTRSVAVRVVVDNPGEVLKKQMYVRVRIRARTPSTGLLVPVSAILRDDENLPFVYAAQTDGSFARRHVTLGYRAGDRYEISDGVKPGDRIVAEGGVFMQFMQSQ